MNSYATLPDLRRYLGLAADQTGDDDLLLMALGAASRLIEGYAGRHFYPARQTRTYTVSDPALLLLDGDLLALHSLTNGDGSALQPADYHLLPSGVPVRSCIVLDRTRAAFTHSGDPVDALAVDGTWGYHPDWSSAWADSGDSVQDDPLSESATALTVADAGAHFAIGQLLQIGDEYLHVQAVDAVTDTLSVARGANGTTAAQHALGAAIAIYQPPHDVRQACLRVASWLYRQPGAGFVQVAGGLRGQVIVPPALPEDVQQILAPYVRARVA